MILVEMLADPAGGLVFNLKPEAFDYHVTSGLHQFLCVDYFLSLAVGSGGQVLRVQLGTTYSALRYAVREHMHLLKVDTIQRQSALPWATSHP